MQFRPYQGEAVDVGLNSDNGVIVLPTGSGKSLVTAGIVKGSTGGVLVLQPSIEILESNLEKAMNFGLTAGVYSASAGRKDVNRVTYATIGSIIKKLDHFAHVETVLIDEAHLVNPKGGMYEELITTLNPRRLIGLTATPYRQASNSFGTSMRIITRTKEKLFKRILYVVNPRDLVEQGYLVNPEFVRLESDWSMLRPNSTGAEYTEASLIQFAKRNGIKSVITKLMPTVEGKHVLVFMDSVADSIELVEMLRGAGYPAAEINAETNKTVRRDLLRDFKGGRIRIMCNVRTLTTGYDFPALDCIIDASPTMSAGLHYQKIGRVVRPFPGKRAVVYCLARNEKRLGNPLNYYMMPNSSGLHEVYGERGRITTRCISDGAEEDVIMSFGKYRGRKMSELPTQYVDWAVEKLSGDWKHIFYSESKRRQLFGKEIEQQKQ